jgi:hypothetical protein
MPRRALVLACLCSLAAPAAGAQKVWGRSVAEWTADIEGDLSRARNPLQARATAMRAVAEAGAKGKAAVPALVARLAPELREHAEYLRRVAAESLGRIGAGAVPALQAALADESDERRVGAAMALGLIGPKAKRAGPELEAARDAGGRVLAVEAALALYGVTGDAEPALEYLRDVLLPGITNGYTQEQRADWNAQVAAELHALRALGRMGAAAAPARADVQRFVEKDAHYRLTARAALVAIDGDAQELAAFFSEFEAEEVYRHTTQAVWVMGARALEALRAGARAPDEALREKYLAQLLYLGPTALPAYEALLASDDAATRGRVARQLALAGSELMPAKVAALAVELSQADLEQLGWGFALSGQHGLDTLVDELGSKDERVLFNATTCINVLATVAIKDLDDWAAVAKALRAVKKSKHEELAQLADATIERIKSATR